MKQMDKIDDIHQLRNDTDLRLPRTTPQHGPDLRLPRTTPQHDPDLRLLRTTLQESSQNGFRVNLLANSLRAKLKQQRLQALKAATHGPDGGGHSSATLNNTTDSTEFVLGEPGHVALSVEQMSRGTPTNNSRVTLSPIVSENLTRSRLNSSIFSSAHSQHTVTPTIKTGKVKNIAVLNNNTDLAEQGDLGCDIKVVKREGIFQPINKYDTVRHPFKGVDSLIRRPACDYDTYILAGDEQRRVNRGGPSGKQLSVSWKPGKAEVGTRRVKEADLSVADEKARSNEDNFPPKVAPEDYAFRRPLFVPAQSKIPSVGVRWTVRTELQETEVTNKYTPRKPMWSWLVMQEETRGEAQQSHGVPGNFNQPPQSSADHLGSHLKTRAARDLHPVSTALDRLGITASKVKWTVPNTGPVDVQQTVMERLELIKRPGSLLYQ